MKSSECFIMKPMFNNLEKSGLHYKDILTYVAIRSFYNIKDKYCYPSYSTIAKRSGLTCKFISDSIRRLENAKLLDVWKVVKSRVTHYYKFPDIGSYQKVPYDVLNNQELTSYEKSMLLLIVEYCDNDLVCSHTITELAELSGQSYRTIDRQLKALTLKGYMVEELIEDSISKTINKVMRLTNKISWLKDMNVKSEAIEKPAFDIDAILAMASKTVRGR